MYTQKQIQEDIAQGNSLKFLAQSYSEVASRKLAQIRHGIEHNRNFLAEIANLYAMVKLVATQRRFGHQTGSRFLVKTTSLLPIPILKGRAMPSDGQKEEKKQTAINILLTSNYRFYGDLEQKLIEFFLQNSRKTQGLPTFVVGRIGIGFLAAIKFTAFEPIVFKADVPDQNELSILIEKVRSFDRVLVYFSSFQSVLSQAPFIKDIKEAQFEVSIPKKKIDYIFEPEIDKMITFFDTQISKILLEQTFLESELARTAARLITMNNAEENANEFLKKEGRLRIQAEKSRYNIDLLDNLSARISKQRREFVRK